MAVLHYENISSCSERTKVNLLKLMKVLTEWHFFKIYQLFVRWRGPDRWYPLPLENCLFLVYWIYLINSFSAPIILSSSLKDLFGIGFASHFEVSKPFFCFYFYFWPFLFSRQGVSPEGNYVPSTEQLPIRERSFFPWSEETSQIRCWASHGLFQNRWGWELWRSHCKCE